MYSVTSLEMSINTHLWLALGVKLYTIKFSIFLKTFILLNFGWEDKLFFWVDFNFEVLGAGICIAGGMLLGAYPI